MFLYTQQYQTKGLEDTTQCLRCKSCSSSVATWSTGLSMPHMHTSAQEHSCLALQLSFTAANTPQHLQGVGGRGSVPKGTPGHTQFCPFAYRAVAALPTFPYTSPPNKLASPNSSGTGANILETWAVTLNCQENNLMGEVSRERSRKS